MLNRISCLAVCASLSMSVLASDPVQQNGPIELSLNEMDHVTAGFTASVDAVALGTSSFLSFTSTNGFATTAVSNSDNPALGGYLAVAGGEALAVAIGAGSTTATSVTPTTDLAGSNIFSNQISIHTVGRAIEINASMIVQIGSVVLNPL